MFKDRNEAGQQLAQRLHPYQHDPSAIVLALPRGGVVLGDQISKTLSLPLDLILVRKLGVPGQEELALGAISIDHVMVLNESIVSALSIDDATIRQIVAKEQTELARRNTVYRHNQPFPNITDKTVILVDDGIATGATMRAAIKIVQLHHPKKVIVAVPLASSSVYQDFAQDRVELVVLATPEPFYGIGMWYGQFPQLTDNEVITLLANAQARQVP